MLSVSHRNPCCLSTMQRALCAEFSKTNTQLWRKKYPIAAKWIQNNIYFLYFWINSFLLLFLKKSQTKEHKNFIKNLTTFLFLWLFRYFVLLNSQGVVLIVFINCWVYGENKRIFQIPVRTRIRLLRSFFGLIDFQLWLTLSCRQHKRKLQTRDFTYRDQPLCVCVNVTNVRNFSVLFISMCVGLILFVVEFFFAVKMSKTQCD